MFFYCVKLFSDNEIIVVKGDWHMVEIKNVTKKFGGFTALEDISFTVDIGSVYGLVGYNGAGKTTLLRCCAGIYRPDGGEVLIGGHNAYDNNVNRHKLFFVPDEIYYEANSSMSDMARFYAGYYPAFSMEIFNNAAELFDLDTKKKIRGFSKGMLRQAEIVFAFACRPQNMLLDEAFDGLDPAKRHIVKQLFLEYAAESGCSMIISSHNLQEISELCDHIGLINGKRLKLSLKTSDIPKLYKQITASFDKEICKVDFDFPDAEVVRIDGNTAVVAAMGNAPEVEEKLKALNPVEIISESMTMEDVFVQGLEKKEKDVSKIFGGVK